EEQARAAGHKLDIYESRFRPMRNTLAGNPEQSFMKLLVDQNDDRVLGVHMVGPDAGELIQGLAVALKAGATKAVFDATLGIHPTAGEEIVTMRTPPRTDWPGVSAWRAVMTVGVRTGGGRRLASDLDSNLPPTGLLE